MTTALVPRIADRMNRFLFTIGAIAIGFAMPNVAGWLGGIHELGHLLTAWAQGHEARILSWSETWVSSRTLLNAHAGYATELIFIALCLGGMIVYRKKGLALFFAGWYWGIFDFAFASYDFGLVYETYPDYPFTEFIVGACAVFAITIVVGRFFRKPCPA